MKNDFTIISSKDNSKGYNTIKKFITEDLLKHIDLLPKNLEIMLYDYEVYGNHTGIVKEFNGYRIDLNLPQILRLYKGKSKINRIDEKHLPKFKSFKNYLLFVLYHELGHYNLKHLFNAVDYLNNKGKYEIDADKFSLRFLKFKSGGGDKKWKRPELARIE